MRTRKSDPFHRPRSVSEAAAAAIHLVDGLHAAHQPLLELVVLGVVLQALLVRLNGLVVLLRTKGKSERR